MQPFMLDPDDVLAHLQFLPVAFVPSALDPPLVNEARYYLLKVEQVAEFIITIGSAAGEEEAFVAVSPLEDTPTELRPAYFACRFACTPEALLTLLAGGAADLSASDIAAMQQFLAAFRFEECAPALTLRRDFRTTNGYRRGPFMRR